MSFLGKLFITACLFAICVLFRNYYKHKVKNNALKKLMRDKNLRIDHQANIFSDRSMELFFDLQSKKMILYNWNSGDTTEFAFNDIRWVSVSKVLNKSVNNLVNKLGLDIKFHTYTYHISFIQAPVVVNTKEYLSICERINVAKNILVPIIQKERELQRENEFLESLYADDDDLNDLSISDLLPELDSLDSYYGTGFHNCEATSTALTNGLVTPKGKLFINVPFEEKDVAKALGARWHPAIKKWYATKRDDYAKFTKWFMDDYIEQVIALDHVYLVVAQIMCHNAKCRKKTTVVTFALESSMLIYDNDCEPRTYKCMFGANTNIHLIYEIKYCLPIRLQNYLKDRFNYYLGLGRSKFENHCQHCGRLQGDYYLYDKFGGAFRLDSLETIQSLTFEEIKLEADWPILATMICCSGDDSLKHFSSFKECEFVLTCEDISTVAVNIPDLQDKY